MNRIDKTFHELAAKGRKALIAFLTAGDPDYTTSLEILKTAAVGADILELGVPFSDPTADGPTIQEASQRALRAGMSFSKSLRLAAELRRSSETPIVLFSYYNPIFKYGLERTAREAADAGVDGFLVVDLPPEEAGPFAKALAPTGIHIIRLAAPTTTDERLRVLTDGAGGFLYLISRMGVTGTGGLDYGEIRARAEHVKARCPLPVCLGFGISTGEDTRALGAFSDGVIVGSALVKTVAQGGDVCGNLKARLSELRRGLDASVTEQA